MECKTFKLMLKLTILISFLLILSNSFANQSAGTCYRVASTEAELEQKIKEGTPQFHRTIIECLKEISTHQQLLDASTPYNLNENPTIITLLDSYNNQKECFYFNISNQDDYQLPTPPSINIIRINTPQGMMPLDIIKDIDARGNLNCQIDTPSEKCKLQLAKERITNPDELNTKQQTELYNCYGNEATPRNLDADPNQLSGKDSFNVFDEETGLIANQQQKNTLENLSNNKAGPVIGFINMIINYLASIVFVLCMASLIYGGYNLIFAGFDSDMQEKGKNAIKYAITGFFLIMLSYTIVILVQSIF